MSNLKKCKGARPFWLGVFVGISLREMILSRSERATMGAEPRRHGDSAVRWLGYGLLGENRFNLGEFSRREFSPV